MSTPSSTFTGPHPPYRISLVGAGRVGTAVATLLRQSGHEIVGVASRTMASAKRAAVSLESTPFRLSDDDIPRADIVLIGATEYALPDVVASLAPLAQPGMLFWHVVGSRGIEPLGDLVAKGAVGCAVHPLQACPNVESAIANLPGSSWGVTTSTQIRAWAHGLVRDDLRGVPIDVAEDDRRLWHAASITTSTGISAVMALGESILESIGVERPDETLGPLVQGTVRNALTEGGGTRTVTGPVVRGEQSTVQEHLDALAILEDDTLARDYGMVASLVLERAVAAGRMDLERYQLVREWLRDATGSQESRPP